MESWRVLCFGQVYYEIEENDIAQKMKVNKSWLLQMQKNFGRVVQGPLVRRPISA